MPNHFDGIFALVRSKLQEQKIKLWLDPYYFHGIGPIESELEKLAVDIGQTLGISTDHCKLALSELQDGALRKLEAKKIFEETGIATFGVRTVRSNGGTQNLTTVKCSLSDLGRDLLQVVADKFNVNDYNQVKVISAGKILHPDRILRDQGLVNNQQLMVLISVVDPTGNEKDAMYDRIQKVKNDVEKIVDSKSQNLFEMEDQDGNAVHLPPGENKAILMALAYYEKGRSAMKKDRFDEALILLLEADQLFSSCNAKILESVDNYALLNLDIVWCYLCLKNVTQLPDAQRRLDICDKNFRRSYGENMNRVMSLKGNAGNERALILRLHLLQGVLMFHQNQRNEAHEKLSLAESELRSLKVNETSLTSLVEMGYDMIESRISLRACNGDISAAINFIMERRCKKDAARQKARKERKTKRGLHESDDQWVNPRSVHTLIEMGFQKELVVAALRKAENDLTMALDFLHTSPEALIPHLPKPITVDQPLIDELTQLGFTPECAQMALENALNDPERAIDFLLKMQSEGNLEELMASLAEKASLTPLPSDGAGPSTSDAAAAGPSTSNSTDFIQKVKTKVINEIESMKAYERFSEDVTNDDDEYLDLPLIQEESVLIEYKKFLEQ